MATPAFGGDLRLFNEYRETTRRSSANPAESMRTSSFCVGIRFHPAEDTRLNLRSNSGSLRTYRARRRRDVRLRILQEFRDSRNVIYPASFRTLLEQLYLAGEMVTWGERNSNAPDAHQF